MVVTCHSHLLSALLLLVLLIAHPAFATLTGYRAEQPINRGSDLDRLGLRSADKNGDGCLSFVEMAAFYSLVSLAASGVLACGGIPPPCPKPATPAFSLLPLSHTSRSAPGV